MYWLFTRVSAIPILIGWMVISRCVATDLAKGDANVCSAVGIFHRQQLLFQKCFNDSLIPSEAESQSAVT